MNILSLSHNSLPDSRVEKAAYTAKRNGHTVFFAGPSVRGSALPFGVFQETYLVPFKPKANLKIPPFWNRLKNTLKKVISDCKADLIHAHNYIAGKLACELNLPFIYDDHEYWSVSLNSRQKTKSHDLLIHPYQQWLATRWEKQILEEAAAVITTCQTVAERHKTYNDYVFVVPNFPSLMQTAPIRIGVENTPLRSVYVGKDITGARPYRNVEGLPEIFIQNEMGTLTVIGDNKLSTRSPLISLGFLPHQEMMKELAKHHIGLLPWKKHWLHKYKDPNKPYEYAHAGLLTLSISDMQSVLKNMPACVKTFEDYKELLELLIYYADNVEQILRIKAKIRQFALKHLLWEKNESKILEAYSK